MATPPVTPTTTTRPTSNKTNNPVELAKDSKFIRFSYQIEKVLASLETVGEWADVPAFLNRLIKCFGEYPQFQTVPHKLVLAKRLAQSLSPTLPTGVHQKALDAYSCIFEYIGPDNLVLELPLYSYGLFPYMSYASLKNKTQLLTLYEKHILSLGQKLRPCSKSLLLAILPGLEEEGSEHFENALFLLDVLCKNVGQSHFFLSLWLSLLSSPKARMPAINFLHRRFPSITSPEDVAFVLGDNSGLMVQAIRASLKDKDYYVKRGILDLLVKFLPLQNKIISPKDLLPLTTTVLTIFLSREMSLNRRVHSWFLGENDTPESISQHFEQFAKQSIVDALIKMISTPRMNPGDLQKPYLIMVSLMDKQELGPVIFQSSLREILKASYAQYKNSTHQTEILTSLGQFLETLDSFFLWSFLFEFLAEIDLSSPTCIEKIETIRFVVTSIELNEEDVELVHLPSFTLASLWNLVPQIEKVDLAKSENEILAIFDLASFVLSKLPKHTFVAKSIKSDSELPEPSSVYSLIRLYYTQSLDDTAHPSEAFSNLQPYLQPITQFQTLAQAVYKFITSYTSNFNSETSCRTAFSKPFQNGCNFILQLTSFQLYENNENDQDSKNILLSFNSHGKLFAGFTSSLIKNCMGQVSFETLDITIVTLVDLVLKDFVSQTQISHSNFLYNTLEQIWACLHPVRGEKHIRAVELVWLLGRVFPMTKIEGYFARRVSISKASCKVSEVDNFGWFWKLSSEIGHNPAKHFSQPLLVIIDALADDAIEVKQASQTWVRSFLDSYLEIFNVMLDFLLNKEFRRIIIPKIAPSFSLVTNPNSLSSDQDLDWIALYETVPDILQADYIFSTLINLTKSEGEAFIAMLQKTTLVEGQYPSSEDSEVNYITFFIQVMMSFLSTELGPIHGSEKSSQNAKLFCTIGQLLRLWLPHVTQELENYLYYPGLLMELGSLLSLRLGHWIQDGCLSPQLEMISSLSTMQFLPPDSFSISTPKKWKQALQYCAEKHFYPIDKEPSSAITDHETKSTSLYFSSLVILAIREPKAERVLQCWCESFLIGVPLYCNHDGIQNIAIPVIDCVLKQLDSPSLPQDKPILVEFVNQLYTNLCAGLGIRKWTAFSNSSRKSHSMFDRLSIMSRTSSQNSADNELGRLLAARIPFILISLTQAWSVSDSTLTELETASPKTTPGSLFISRTKTEVVKSFEDIASLFHKDFPLAFIEAWLMLSGAETSNDNQNSFLLFKILAKTPSFSITSFFHECLLIAKKVITDYSSGHKSNKWTNNRHLPMTDLSIIKFLEIFFQELPSKESQSLSSTWLIFITFYKETLYNIASQKYLLFPLLRLFDQYCLHSGYPESIHDKKLRREVQDVFQRLLDQLLVVVCKPLEQSSWLRLPSAKASDESVVDKNLSETNQVDSKQAIPSDMLHVYQVMSYIEKTTLPLLPSLLVDTEKITSFLSNLMYYFIGPSLKPLHSCYQLSLDMLKRISNWDYSYRCWKREVWEAFLDPGFFNQSLSYFNLWTILLAVVVKQEKDKIPDIIGRITPTPSNLFTNRELEILNRARMLRRLSFLLHCSAIDAQLIHLQLIQEKIAELLKSSTPTMIQIEAFLCLRVLLCRFSSHQLTSFWPILLTELVRVFQSVKVRPSISGGSNPVDTLTSEEEQHANLVLAVCKFLDTVFLFRVEEFQIYQWLFVNETLDFVNHHHYSNHSILDQLGNNPSTKQQEAIKSQKGKPKLRMRKVSNLQELQPFFNSISSMVFSTSYFRLLPDIPAIEHLILRDFRDDSSDIPLTPEVTPPTLQSFEDEEVTNPLELPLDEEGYLFQL